jgi:hypothetical protein
VVEGDTVTGSAVQTGQKYPPVGGVTTVAVKLAETLLAAFIVTVHAAVPLHAPPQPVKLWPLVACAIKLTLVPVLKGLVQLALQTLPSEKLTLPAPETVSVSVVVLVGVGADAGGAMLKGGAVVLIAVSVPPPPPQAAISMLMHSTRHQLKTEV